MMQKGAVVTELQGCVNETLLRLGPAGGNIPRPSCSCSCSQGQGQVVLQQGLPLMQLCVSVWFFSFL